MSEKTVLEQLRDQRVQLTVIALAADIQSETITRKRAQIRDNEISYKEMNIFMGRVLLALVKKDRGIIHEIKYLRHVKSHQEIREILLERYFANKKGATK